MIAVLVLALAAALAFELVNGFHDTANAVATVIYTKTLPAPSAVVLSGVCNFLGVFLGGIGVAMAIVRLLPVELVVAGGSARGMAMIASLLGAAIAWNAGTWYLALPASSSHTLIGAILGVGIASSAMDGHVGQGVAWNKAAEVFTSLLLSPCVGFLAAAVLLSVLRAFAKNPRIFSPPKEGQPAPRWIRAVLIGTCSGVSFAHGSNDGQKGVGLVMLILVGLLPAEFALDRSASAAELDAARDGALRIAAIAGPGPCADAAEAMAATLGDVTSVDDLDPEARWHARQDFVRMDAALRDVQSHASDADVAQLRASRASVARLTEYAPTWVLIAVAMALGLGTMVGWKRIVVTVGERIGKAHLSYAQGACAEVIAMSTVGVSSAFGLPVSTTHVLSSAVAGTMVADRAGLQMGTVRKIALAWLLTLPVSALVAGVLFVILSTFFAG